MQKKRIKILFVITGLTKSGAETQLYNLITNLSPKFEIIILTFVKGEYYDLLKENYKVYFYPTSTLKFWDTVKYILKIINEENPDIVNSWLVHANILCKIAKLISNNKFILLSSVRGMEATHKLHEILERIFDFSSDGIITNSYFMEERLVKKLKYVEKKINVIYNGVQFRELDHKDIRKELGFEKSTSIITTVANFRYGKDYETTVKVAMKLSKEIEDCVFLFIGEGTKKVKIEKMVERAHLKNRVFFLGRRNDVPEILSNSDVMFLPTLYESQSNAILEAMFYKCPIVTTDIPANREILKDGSSSFLVEIKDYHKMAERIITLLNNENIRRTFVEQALTNTKELFSIKKMANEYEVIYEHFYDKKGTKQK